MNFKLTTKYQYSKHCRDGHDRNYIIYFLNGVQILKQKIPFDERYEAGYDRTTHIGSDYLLNGYIYQKRTRGRLCCCSSNLKTREVKFPVSKKILKELGVPTNLIINEEYVNKQIEQQFDL